MRRPHRLFRKPGALISARHSTNCLNCGAPLSGAFCAACGQRDIPPYPTVRELAVDAVTEFSGWDGRLSSTLRTLVRRPGLLTKEFLEGRRARYISPLRLYLVASLIYFLLAASAPKVGDETNLRVGATAGEDDSTASGARRVGEAASAALDKGKAVSAEERAAALAEVARAPAPMRPVLRRAIEDPEGFKGGILQTMPKMLFALLPVFAGIVALFFRGRKYPEHLYFAIHLHAFVFLALAVVQLLKFTQVQLLVSIATVIGLIWIPVYATLAFRRVYGGSLARTLAKETGIAVLYVVTAMVGFMAMIYWVSIAV